MYKKFGYVIYRQVIGYYTGGPEEDAYGKKERFVFFVSVPVPFSRSLLSVLCSPPLSASLSVSLYQSHFVRIIILIDPLRSALLGRYAQSHVSRPAEEERDPAAAPSPARGGGPELS